MNTHELKCWPDPFQATMIGDKNFEYRKNDRGFHVGDKLILREYDPLKNGYTGIVIFVKVTYMLEGSPNLPMTEGYCVLGTKIERVEVW